MAIVGGAAALALTGAVVVNSALAGEPGRGGAADARTLAAGPGTITCPDVASRLPAVPASAKAEVDRNLALLKTQIDEANTRLVKTVGQGGPDFVQNAILGPLKDKRVSTIDRIALAIGRKGTKPQGLDALAGCALGTGGTGAGGAATRTPGGQGNAGNAGGNGSGTAGNTGPGTITCPDVASRLPAVPPSAKAEVDRNLALLKTQIDEANTRLAKTVGQGGPHFVQNAILGPLKDKRVSTIDRIALAIGRKGTRPQGLDALAACTSNR
ncbi:hypothetical protein E4U92_22350 [Streptomyces galbus]|uniref:Secreted protein n=1 Tax=Streptomyces galbus TaxID=33898 RepID=A0A4U5WYF5_STRGB|nr:hypothetical protein E4U92_22350 [Streptomyces galbus]